MSTAVAPTAPTRTRVPEHQLTQWATLLEDAVTLLRARGARGQMVTDHMYAAAKSLVGHVADDMYAAHDAAARAAWDDIRRKGAAS